MKPAARLTLALVASAMVWGASSAQAADLGGDCCADLEERIAELEATTARKGNRKVSLTISGWVNEAAFFWDDGQESNVYVGTNSLEQDRVKFTGEASISSDWSAGYTIELGINGSPSGRFSQDDTATGIAGQSNAVTTRKANWFLKSKTFGKVTVGQEGTATYHLLDDADGANTRNYSDAEAAAVALGRFDVLVNGAAQGDWIAYMGGFNNATPGQSGRRNVVRYDSPAVAGFVVTAAWGEDDIWDVALTYKGEVGDFKLLGKVGYGQSTDPKAQAAQCTVGNGDCEWWGAAGTIMHAPTGLYVYGGFGSTTADGLAAGLDDESTTWFVQAGIERKWLPIGKTTVFGEYRSDDAGFRGTAFLGNPALGANFDFYAAGVVQNIEAASMDLYAIYRHSEGDISTVAGNTSIDDFDMVITGARIQF
jgi:predicted porin